MTRDEEIPYRFIAPELIGTELAVHCDVPLNYLFASVLTASHVAMLLKASLTIGTPIQALVARESLVGARESLVAASAELVTAVELARVLA